VAIFLRPSLPAWVYTGFLLLPLLVGLNTVAFLKRTHRALLSVVSVLTVTAYAAVAITLNVDVTDVSPWWLAHLFDWAGAEMPLKRVLAGWVISTPEIGILLCVTLDICVSVRIRRLVKWRCAETPQWISDLLLLTRTGAIFLLLLVFPSPFSIPHWAACIITTWRCAKRRSFDHVALAKENGICYKVQAWFVFAHIMILQIISALPFLVTEYPYAAWILGVQAEKSVCHAQVQAALLITYALLSMPLSELEGILEDDSPKLDDDITRSNSLTEPLLATRISTGMTSCFSPYLSPQVSRRIVPQLTTAVAGFFLSLSMPSITGMGLAAISLALAFFTTRDLTVPERQLRDSESMRTAEEGKYGAIHRDDYSRPTTVIGFQRSARRRLVGRMPVVGLSLALLAFHSIASAMQLLPTTPLCLSEAMLPHVVRAVVGSEYSMHWRMAVLQIFLLFLIVRAPRIEMNKILEQLEPYPDVSGRIVHLTALALTVWWSGMQPGAVGPLIVLAFLLARTATTGSQAKMWLQIACGSGLALLMTQYLWIVVAGGVIDRATPAPTVFRFLGIDLLMPTLPPSHKSLEEHTDFGLACLEMGTCVALCLGCRLPFGSRRNTELGDAAGHGRSLWWEHIPAWVFSWGEACGWFCVLCLQLWGQPGPLQALGCLLLLQYPGVLLRHGLAECEHDPIAVAWGAVAASVWGLRMVVRHAMGNEPQLVFGDLRKMFVTQNLYWEDFKDIALIHLLARMVRGLATSSPFRSPPKTQAIVQVRMAETKENSVKNRKLTLEDKTGAKNHGTAEGSSEISKQSEEKADEGVQKEAIIIREESKSSVKAQVGSIGPPPGLAKNWGAPRPLELELDIPDEDDEQFPSSTLCSPSSPSYVRSSASLWDYAPLGCKTVHTLLTLAHLTTLAWGAGTLDSTIVSGGYLCLLTMALVLDIEVEVAIGTICYAASVVSLRHSMRIMNAAPPVWLGLGTGPVSSHPGMLVMVTGILRLQCVRFGRFVAEQWPSPNVPQTRPARILAQWNAFNAWVCARAGRGDMMELACLALITTIFVKEASVLSFFDLAVASAPLYLPSSTNRRAWTGFLYYGISAAALRWLARLLRRARAAGMGSLTACAIFGEFGPGVAEIIGILVVTQQAYAFWTYGKKLPKARSGSGGFPLLRSRADMKGQSQLRPDERGGQQQPTQPGNNKRPEGESQQRSEPAPAPTPLPLKPPPGPNDPHVINRVLLLKAFLVLTALFAFAIGALRLGGGTGFEPPAMRAKLGKGDGGQGGLLACLYVVACVSIMGQLQGLFAKKRQWKWMLIGALNTCVLFVALACRFSLLQAAFEAVPSFGANACKHSVVLDIILFGLLGLRRRLFELGYGVQLRKYWQMMKMHSLVREQANRERRKWLEKVTQLEVTIAYFKRQLRYYERWKERSAPKLSKGVSLVLDECGIDLDLQHATMDSIAGVVKSLEDRRQALELDPAAAPIAGASFDVTARPSRVERQSSTPLFGASTSFASAATTRTFSVEISVVPGGHDRQGTRGGVGRGPRKRTGSSRLRTHHHNPHPRMSARASSSSRERKPSRRRIKFSDKLPDDRRPESWGDFDSDLPQQQPHPALSHLRRAQLQLRQGGEVLARTRERARRCSSNGLAWESVTISIDSVSTVEPIELWVLRGDGPAGGPVAEEVKHRPRGIGGGKGTKNPLDDSDELPSAIGWCQIELAEFMAGGTGGVETTLKVKWKDAFLGLDFDGEEIKVRIFQGDHAHPYARSSHSFRDSKSAGGNLLELLPRRKSSKRKSESKRTATQTVQERIWQGVYYKRAKVSSSSRRRADTSHLSFSTYSVPPTQQSQQQPVMELKSPPSTRLPRVSSSRSPLDHAKDKGPSTYSSSEDKWREAKKAWKIVVQWVVWALETAIATLWLNSDFHDLAQHPGTRLQRAGRAFGAWVLSNTGTLCYMAFVADHVAAYNPMSVVFPLSMFLIAIPSPDSKRYWKAMASYCSAIIALKTFLRLPFIADNIIGGGIITVLYYPKEYPYGAPGSTDIRPALEWDLAFDALVLLALAAHRQILILKGAWDSPEDTEERIREARFQKPGAVRRRQQERHHRRDSSLTLSPEPPDVTEWMNLPHPASEMKNTPTRGGREASVKDARPRLMTSSSPVDSPPRYNATGGSLEIEKNDESNDEEEDDVEDDDDSEEDSEEDSSSDATQRVSEKDRKHRTLSSLIDHFKQHYLRVKRKRPLTSRDLYGWIFWTEVIAFIMIVTSFPRFSGNYGDSLQETFASNRVPLAFFFAMFTQFLMIVIDRVLYLTNSRRWKGRLQIIGVIGIHSMVFLLPLANTPPLGSNPGLMNSKVTYRVFSLFYLVKAVYLFASAHQVRSGYPPFAKEDGTFPRPSLTGLVVFILYRAIPFLFEAKTILDWTCYSSPLFFGDWLKLQDIHCNLYMVECDLVYRKSLRRKKGDIYNTEIKVVVGFFAIFGLVLIVWLPFMIYLTGVPLFMNPLQSVTLTVQIETAHNSWRLCEHSDVISIREVPHGPRLDALRAPPYNLPSNLVQETVQQVTLSGDSTYAWTITPPSLRKLREIMQKDRTCRLVMTFRFEMESGSVSRVRYETLLDRGQMLRTLNASHESPDGFHRISVDVKDAYPLFTHILAAGVARPVGPKVTLRLSRVSADGSEWWAIQSLCLPASEHTNDVEYRNPALQQFREMRNAALSSLKSLTGDSVSDEVLTEEEETPKEEPKNSDSYRQEPKNADSNRQDSDACHEASNDPERIFGNDGIMFFTLSDQMLLGKLIDSSVYEYGMFALYFTVVFSLGRFLRVYVVGMSHRIIYEDWGDVEFVKELLNDIYAARWDREHELEEEMYGELIQLYRSPEKLQEVTRPPKRLVGIMNWPSTAKIKSKMD